MTRHISPNNQVSVPVLDKGGKPLAPTRPSRARHLLKQRRAVKCRKHGRFAIKILDRATEDCTVPETILGIDPGTRRTGMAVTVQTKNGAKVISGTEIHHRGQRISSAMITRHSHRRNRRSRLRRRPARFDNRTRKPDWLPPSMVSIRANILTNAKHLKDLFPVSGITVETCRFDPRLMADPNVEGKGYQTSERGRMQIREYVLQRDRRTCQYCGKAGGKLEVDHIVPQSKGGAYRIGNLVTACEDCNRRKSNQPLEEFLRDDPEKLKRALSQTKKSLNSATHMNHLMPLIMKGLEGLEVPVAESDAVETAYTRKRLGVPKTHVNDAACLNSPETLTGIPETVTVIRAVGHGKRQMLTPPSKHGTPRYITGPKGRNRGYRAYCKLPRDQQGFTTMPGHRGRQRRVKGVTSGDLVRYIHPVEGAVMGYATLVLQRRFMWRRDP